MNKSKSKLDACLKLKKKASTPNKVVSNLKINSDFKKNLAI